MRTPLVICRVLEKSKIKQREMCDDELVPMNGCLYVLYVLEYETIETYTFKSSLHPWSFKDFIRLCETYWLGMKKGICNFVQVINLSGKIHETKLYFVTF